MVSMVLARTSKCLSFHIYVHHFNSEDIPLDVIAQKDTTSMVSMTNQMRLNKTEDQYPEIYEPKQFIYIYIHDYDINRLTVSMPVPKIMAVKIKRNTSCSRSSC